MGLEQFSRPVFSPKNLAVVTSTATLTDAVITLPSEGVAFITYGTSGNSNDAIIPTPDFKGAQLTVVLDNNTTSIEANFNTDSTGNVFFGSSFNTIAVASTANDTVFFGLTGFSTSQWAITSLSSTIDWTLSAGTGSTGQS